MFFKLPSPEEILKIAPHLIPKIIIKDNKYWYVKSDPNSVNRYKNDLLGWTLGKTICNIAEVKLLLEEELGEIKPLLNLQSEANTQNTYLVRLAGTYAVNELPCQTLEKSVATELVYSIWIRRRDTHADNREYVPEGGIPVFYDFHIAFFNESRWAHTTPFFKDDPDYGHPAYWRIKEIGGKMTTSQARSVTNPNHKAWHYINNTEIFKTELKQAEVSIKNIPDLDIKNAICRAGFDDKNSDYIYDFLTKNLITLHSDIEEMMKIVFQA